MKATDLQEFVHEYEPEYHWFGDDVIMFVYLWQLEKFIGLLSVSHFDDDGIECHLRHNYAAFEMKDICDYYGIELGDVFKHEDS